MSSFLVGTIRENVEEHREEAKNEGLTLSITGG
jgi:hypothetical protein